MPCLPARRARSPLLTASAAAFAVASAGFLLWKNVHDHAALRSRLHRRARRKRVRSRRASSAPRSASARSAAGVGTVKWSGVRTVDRRAGGNAPWLRANARVDAASTCSSCRVSTPADDAAIAAYRPVQTIGKTSAGGWMSGFVRLRYHRLVVPDDAAEPAAAAAPVIAVVLIRFVTKLIARSSRGGVVAVQPTSAC